MLSSFLPVLALGAFASLSAALPNEASLLIERNDLVEKRQSTSSCATGLHLIIAGGCSIPCGADVPGLLVTLIGNITEAFPGTDQYYVPYDGSQYQGQVSTPLAVEAATEYFQSCPNTPVVFLGYSLGGIITMNTVCGGIDPSYAPNVLAVVTYGEETFRYPEPWDMGTCTQNAPNYPRNNTDQCTPFAPAIADFCDADDPECCLGGTSPTAHFVYPFAYDIDATNFIKGRYAARVGGTTTTSSTSTTPTSTSYSMMTTTMTSTSESTTMTMTSTSSVPVLPPPVISPAPVSPVGTGISGPGKSMGPFTNSSIPVVMTTVATTTVPSNTVSTGSPTSTLPYSVPAGSTLTIQVTLTTTATTFGPTSTVEISYTTVTPSVSNTPGGQFTLTSVPVVTFNTATAIPNSVVIFPSVPPPPPYNTPGTPSAIAPSGTGVGPSMTPFTGASSRLPIPGAAYLQLLVKAWKLLVRA